MNLHLSHYPNTFIKHFIEHQEACSNEENRYCLYTNEPNIKGKDDDPFDIVPADVAELEAYLGGWGKYKVLYMHYFSNFLVDLVNTLPSNITVVWIFWGADGFLQIPNYLDSFCLQTQTKAYYDENIRVKMKWCKNPFYLYKNYKTYKKSYPTTFYKAYLKATARIDYFAHYIPEDYKLIQKHSPLKAKYINYNYMSVPQFRIPVASMSPKTNNVIIGNSADWSNNHLDLIQTLQECQHSDIEKIYMPLSYGGNPKYIETVSKKGAELLGDKFTPITNFLPLEEYYDILRNVSVALIGTARSQASANIISLLLQGTRVYMDKRSTLYHCLKDAGCILFDLEQDLKKDMKAGKITFLTEEETKQNEQVLIHLFGREAVLNKFKDLFNLVSTVV